MRLTLLLVLLSVIFYIATWQNPDYFVENLGFSLNALAEGRYYTILTSLFMHANLLHLVTNMIALLSLGGSVEGKGAIRYLLVYFLAGVAGVFAAIVPIFNYSTETLFVGASGAISGIIGYGIFINPGSWVTFPWIIPIPFAIAAGVYLLTTLSFLFVTNGVAYPAHLFGLLFGMAFGFLFGEKRIKRLILFIIVMLLIVTVPVIVKSVLGWQ